MRAFARTKPSCCLSTLRGHADGQFRQRRTISSPTPSLRRGLALIRDTAAARPAVNVEKRRFPATPGQGSGDTTETRAAAQASCHLAVPGTAARQASAGAIRRKRDGMRRDAQRERCLAGSPPLDQGTLRCLGAPAELRREGRHRGTDDAAQSAARTRRRGAGHRSQDRPRPPAGRPGPCDDPRPRASKLATARQLDAATATASLGPLLELGTVSERELYAALDWLLSQQSRIESREPRHAGALRRQHDLVRGPDLSAGATRLQPRRQTRQAADRVRPAVRQ